MQNENKVQVPPIINTRTLPYRRELVFSAWSDPSLVAQWWGPHGFTNTIHLFEFFPGGRWLLTMHGPDGTDYHNESVFVDIRKNEKIILHHLEPIHQFTATVTFQERDDQTELTLSMVFDLLSEYEKLKDFIAAANEENFDRLESVLKNIK